MEFMGREQFHIMGKSILKVRNHMDLVLLLIKTNNTMKAHSTWVKLNQFTDGTKKIKESANKESTSKQKMQTTST